MNDLQSSLKGFGYIYLLASVAAAIYFVTVLIESGQYSIEGIEIGFRWREANPLWLVLAIAAGLQGIFVSLMNHFMAAVLKLLSEK